MRKWILAMILVFAMAVPAFATNWGDTYNDYDYTITNQGGQGGAGGSVGNVSATGGAGGSAIVNDNSKTYNTNTNINGQHQGQVQGQLQGQNQEINNGQVISPFQSIVIEAQKRAYLGAPSVGVPELNFGNGKIILDIAKSLPKFGIPILEPTDDVKELLDITANIKFKNLYKTILGMKKALMPLCYNVKVQVVMMEGQKSWTSGGSLSGAGSYVGTAGSAASGSLIPSWGGTKADPLFTVIMVKTVK